MNPIIFLDIDGVLCTLRSHYAFGDDGGLMSAWDITVCQMIRRLCSKYDAKIVVSSTWRNNPPNVRTYLCTYGLADHMVSELFRERIKGNVLNHDWITPKSDHVPHATRGTEIQMWLDANPKYKNYIIIDDDSDMLNHQLPFFVKTDGYEGFGARDYEKCEVLLKSFKDGIHANINANQSI